MIKRSWVEYSYFLNKVQNYFSEFTFSAIMETYYTGCRSGELGYNCWSIQYENSVKPFYKYQILLYDGDWRTIEIYKLMYKSDLWTMFRNTCSTLLNIMLIFVFRGEIAAMQFHAKFYCVFIKQIMSLCMQSLDGFDTEWNSMYCRKNLMLPWAY